MIQQQKTSEKWTVLFWGENLGLVSVGFFFGGGIGMAILDWHGPNAQVVDSWSCPKSLGQEQFCTALYGHFFVTKLMNSEKCHDLDYQILRWKSWIVFKHFWLHHSPLQFCFPFRFHHLECSLFVLSFLFTVRSGSNYRII